MAFLMRQMMAGNSHVALVVVKAVTASTVSGAPPTVDVQPMVAMVDQTGTASAHGVVNAVPTFRYQSGTWAFVLDPQVDDIGVVVCADRDISSAMASQAPANPGSFRRFDWSDALYFGGFARVAPDNYVKADADGITIQVKAGKILTINADTLNIAASDGSSDAQVNLTGTLTASVDVVSDGTSGHTHKHSGVTVGSGDTGAPV